MSFSEKCQKEICFTYGLMLPESSKESERLFSL